MSETVLAVLITAFSTILASSIPQILLIINNKKHIKENQRQQKATVYMNFVYLNYQLDFRATHSPHDFFGALNAAILQASEPVKEKLLKYKKLTEETNDFAILNDAFNECLIAINQELNSN